MPNPSGALGFGTLGSLVLGSAFATTSSSWMDHETLALDRRFAMDLEKTNTERLLRIYLRKLQEIEDVLEILAGVDSGELLFADADGWILDLVYGRRLALLRQPGWDDDTYRTWLRIRALALRSNGTAPELIELGEAMRTVPSVEPVIWRPEYPAGYRVEVPDVDPALYALATQMFADATVAGVRGVIVFWQSALSPFVMSGVPGSTYGLGAGHLGHAFTFTGNGG